LLAEQDFVFLYKVFGMDPHQSKKVGINGYMRITLTKFFTSALSLSCLRLVPVFLFEEEMEPEVKRSEGREIDLTHKVQQLFYLVGWCGHEN
jgi:hypothetical protein